MSLSKKIFKELWAVYLVLLVGAIVIIAVYYVKQHYYGYSYKKLIQIENKNGGVNKQTVLKDLKIAEHGGNPPYSFIPVGNFGGKLKKTGTVKIVFGLAGKHKSTVAETFGNIYYILRYLKYRKINYKLALVIYGAQASRLGYKQMDSKLFDEALKAFHRDGLKVYVCYNALMINREVKAMIPKFVRPVPMGILKIYELRKKGYMYFTNP